MRIFATRACLALTLLLNGAAASAQTERELTAAEYAGLSELTDKLRQATSELDTRAIFSHAPPKMLDQLAQSQNMSASALVEKFTQDNQPLEGGSVAFDPFAPPAAPATGVETGDMLCVPIKVAYVIRAHGASQRLQRTLYAIYDKVAGWRGILLPAGPRTERLLIESYGVDICQPGKESAAAARRQFGDSAGHQSAVATERLRPSARPFRREKKQ